VKKVRKWQRQSGGKAHTILGNEFPLFLGPAGNGRRFGDQLIHIIRQETNFIAAFLNGRWHHFLSAVGHPFILVGNCSGVQLKVPPLPSMEWHQKVNGIQKAARHTHTQYAHMNADGAPVWRSQQSSRKYFPPFSHQFLVEDPFILPFGLADCCPCRFWLLLVAPGGDLVFAQMARPLAAQSKGRECQICCNDACGRWGEKVKKAKMNGVPNFGI
jgi:hypothetical protein